MKHFIIYFILTIIISTFLISCNNPKHNNKKKNSKDSLLTKTIKFPNNLLKLENDQFKDINNFRKQIKDKSKIISIIDATCMKCIINQLNKTDSIFQKHINNDRNIMIFILNVHKEDSAYFMQNLRPAINADGLLLLDNNYNFERENDLFTPNINLRTFMVNSDNEIIKYGNPLMDPSIINDYKEKLTN